MNGQLNEALIDQNYLTLQMTDRIFQKSYNYFKICNYITIAYAIGKVIASPVFFFIENSSVEIQIWIVCLFVIGCFQTIHYLKMHKVSSKLDVYLRIASMLNHTSFLSVPIRDSQGKFIDFNTIQGRVHQTIDFSNPLAEQIDDRKIKLISLQIKYSMQKQSNLLFWSGKIQFVLYQIIHIWGFVIWFNLQQQSPASSFMIVILFLGTYQYLQFYILLIIIIIVVPFLLLWQLFKWIRDKKQKKDAMKQLQEQTFTQQLQGDHQCKICMGQYNLEQKIIVLKCNNLHHFHASCIKKWVDVNPNCPVCRKVLY